MARYQRPETLRQALTQLHDNPNDTVVIAGGTTIVPFLRPNDEDTILLDIGRIGELKDLICEADIIIGSAVTLKEFLTYAQKQENPVLGALYNVASCIADPTIRGQATVGGNVARGGELATILLALDAEIIVESLGGGSRRIRLKDLLLDPGVTALGHPDELLIAIVVHNQKYDYIHYDKFTKSHLASIPLASVAVAACDRDIRVALGSHRLFPERLSLVERRLVERDLTVPTGWGQLGGLVDAEVFALTDDSYHNHIIHVLLERALMGPPSEVNGQ